MSRGTSRLRRQRRPVLPGLDVGVVEQPSLCSEARPRPKPQRVVERGWVGDVDRNGLGVYARQAGLDEGPPHLMGGSPVADAGPEAQHAIRQILVRDVHDLRAVVGVRDDDHAAGADHPRNLGQRLRRIGEMLERPVRPRAVEPRRLEGQGMGIREEHLGEATPPCLGDHGGGAVYADHLDAVPSGQLDRVRAGTDADLEIPPAGRRVEELGDPRLVARIQRVRPQRIEHVDPGLGIRLVVHVCERMLRATHAPTVAPCAPRVSRRT
jgi:hypothetical protein